MKFSKDYSKFKNPVFTTIRKNTQYYTYNSTHVIRTPIESFDVKIIELKPIKKIDITEKLAWNDADCCRSDLVAMLENWYGKAFDDYVLLTLKKESQ